ncbi:hypothetical protein Q7514_17305 [Rhodococcus artemisiae]|uniref:DUF1918 domain-containing protein n=1 Tax=Rhodococcus artemisiae TaxID=714159 RepID=A0ABU7LCK9_9NOCA|nr:hypothetical protein [Rhodococcus artemisiae]MEE2059278.1 hypothetical protein [Rhodococcus artemisiae]
MAGPTSNSSPQLSVGTAVIVRAGVAETRSIPGKIVEDYGSTQQVVGADLGRDWAPIRRWAVALDDGRLVFVDDDDLEVAPA